MDDLYGVLELEKGASAEEIKANYRRLAMKWHPDRNAGSRQAEERFKRISEAYSVLSDDARRADYDTRLSGSWSGQGTRGGEGVRDGGRDRGFEGFTGFSGFTAEQAAYMFMEEMQKLAAELTMQNVGWRDIAQELISRGCPDVVAADIARKIEIKRKAAVRGRARPYFLRSAVSGFMGVCMVGLFGGLGFGILGFIGLIMFLSGGYNLLRAFYFMTTGNAPRTPF